MAANSPKPIHEEPARLRTALGEARTVFLCLDFDGTLAPIVDDPNEAIPTDAAVDALEHLTVDPAVTTAIVSGRSLADVRERIDGPKIFAGNHGLEIRRNGSVSVHPIAQKRAALVDDVCMQLESELAAISGAWVENKRLTGTVHLRSVATHRVDTVERIAKSVTDRIGDDALELSNGKQVVEISPRIPWGKGNAVELLRSSMPSDPLVVYIGDDVTDESAFRAVEPDGIGIHVGTDPESEASYRVRSPSDVASFLHWFAVADVASSPKLATARA